MPAVVSSLKGTRPTRPCCRADGVVLGVLALLRALCAGEDVVARIVFLWAWLVTDENRRRCPRTKPAWSKGSL